jgi:hypothetical protein
MTDAEKLDVVRGQIKFLQNEERGENQ